jgi:SPP1 family predicted phage head-tail adaptor
MSGLSDAGTPSLGSLRDRVQLTRRDVADDGQGGSITTFVPMTSLWGRVRQLSSGRTVVNDGRVVSISHSAVLRYRTDIRPGDRLVVSGRNLDVVSAADLNGRRAYLSCLCAETVVTG